MNKVKDCFSKPIIDLIDALGVNVSLFNSVEFGMSGINMWQAMTAAGLYFAPLDRIFINQFSDIDKDMVLLHELGHWTGHMSRANRVAIDAYLRQDRSYLTREKIDTEEMTAHYFMLFFGTMLGLDAAMLNDQVVKWSLRHPYADFEAAQHDAAYAVNWVCDQLESIKRAA